MEQEREIDMPPGGEWEAAQKRDGRKKREGGGGGSWGLKKKGKKLFVHPPIFF